MLANDNKYQPVISVSIYASLILTLVYYLDGEFIRYNLGQAVSLLLSAHLLFFVAVGVLLSRKWITDKWYSCLAYLFPLLHSLIFYGNYLNVFRMAGDNVCQIAYWKILFHQNLTGSIGASFTKPGQLLILGVLYQLSLSVGPLVFTIGLSLVMAACVWSLIRIATDIGGRAAGIIAFPVAVWAFTLEFLSGSFSIFLIPTLFTGIWLYFYKPGFKTLGSVLIVLTIHFHIHAISVIGVVWLILMFRKERKELLRFSLYSAISVALWVWVIYRVQGAVERLNSGAAVGYVGPLEGVPENGISYMVSVVQDGFVHQPYIRLLFILGIIGVFGAFFYGRRMYLIVFSSLLILIINVIMLSGTFNLERYCSTFYAFGCSVGVGSVVRHARDIWLSKSLSRHLIVIAAFLLMVTSFDLSVFNIKNEKMTSDYDKAVVCDYVVSARNILSDRFMGEATRLMTEDDILYSLVIMDADRFSSLTALQYFNVSEVAVRKQMLANTDYIWIALNRGHPYYYLSHLVVPEWEKDYFRVTITNVLNTNQPSSLYGFSIIPVDRNDDRLILRVVPENIPH